MRKKKIKSPAFLGGYAEYMPAKKSKKYLSIDIKGINKLIESFERVEEISDIILIGKDGGVRRIEIND